MKSLVLTFIISFFLTFMLVRYAHLHIGFTGDQPNHGKQKFHQKATPRIGGLSIYISIFVIILYNWLFANKSYEIPASILVCAFPIFIVGFIEDITKSVSIRDRLLAAIFSGALGVFLFSFYINRIDLAFLDAFFKVPIITMMLTPLAVAGLANSYNIIDGYNGLLSVVAILIMLPLLYVSKQVGDYEITELCFLTIGAILGFLVWNYPKGMIFIGDSGAYLVGFIIAELSIVLVSRHDQVSAWFPFLVNFYPLFEMFFSIWRKKILRKMSPGVPDGLHLHMLVYKRLVRWSVGSKIIERQITRNALTAPYLWVISCFAIIPAAFFWDNTKVLILFVILFSLGYLLIYNLILNNQIPNWLKIKHKNN